MLVKLPILLGVDEPSLTTVIPELTESEFQNLKAAIKSAGCVHVPVVRDGEGHHELVLV